MTTADRLLQRLRDMGLELPEGTILRRVYASRAGRNNGAWSWYAVGPDGAELHIGSHYPMAVLVRAPVLEAVRAYEDTNIEIPKSPGGRQ